MAQRLVRRVCKHCREPYLPTDFERTELPLLQELMSRGEVTHIYRAKGCRECRNTGYRGRLGIYELLTVTDEIRSLIVRRVDATIIKKEAIKEGMLTLRDDGALKIARGITTVEEVLRVTQDDMV
jgi:general secretion pathway protein E